ncbi:hypothetical protein Hdeb2414_s0102g00794141 [Helianthus debilis subsp. tardiflorus]
MEVVVQHRQLRFERISPVNTLASLILLFFFKICKDLSSPAILVVISGDGVVIPIGHFFYPTDFVVYPAVRDSDRWSLSRPGGHCFCPTCFPI